MATMKKTNEAWFGDTFNRDVTLCYATEDESNYNTILKSLAMSSPQIIDKDACGEVTFTIAKNASVNQVDSLSDKIRDIQAQIHDLRKSLETKKENSELRSALKTLHYKREVE